MVLAFDVGTSVLKGALFDRNGTPVSRAELPLELISHPDPLWHESDARGWVKALRLVAHRIGHSDAGPLDAVVVSGNGPPLLPVGADGIPLSPAMTWMDRRGVTEAGIISEKSGRPTDPTLRSVTHALPSSQPPLPGTWPRSP